MKALSSVGDNTTKITEVINTSIPEDSEYVAPKPKTRVLFCGTHPN